MKPKDLFADIPEPDDDPFTGEQTHFASMKAVCQPIQAWMEANLGPVRHGVHQGVDNRDYK